MKQIQKVKLILLPLIISLGLLSHFPLANFSGSALNIFVNIITWSGVALCFFILVFIHQVIAGRILYKQDSFLLIGVGLLCVATLINVTVLNEHALLLLGILAGFFIFYLFRQFATPHKHYILFFILCILLLGGVIEVGISLLQIKLQLNNESGWVRMGVHVPVGAFGQRNVLSSFLATQAACIWFLAARFRSLMGQSGWNLFNVYSCLCFTLTAFVLVFAESLTGYITFIVVCLLGYINTRKIKLKNTYVLFILLGVVGAILIKSNYGTEHADKLTSANTRLQTYSDSIEIIKAAPILGYGVGSTRKAMLDVMYNITEEEKADRWYYQDHQMMSHPHNEVLFRWVETGVLGVIGLLLVFAFLVKTIFDVNRSKQLLFIGLFFPVLFHSLVEFPMYISALHYVFFIIFLALASAYGASSKSYINMPSAVNHIFKPLALLSVCFMFIVWQGFSYVYTFKTTGKLEAQWLDNIWFEAPFSRNIAYYRQYIRSLEGGLGQDIEQKKEFVANSEAFLSLYPWRNELEMTIRFQLDLELYDDALKNIDKAQAYYYKDDWSEYKTLALDKIAEREEKLILEAETK
ncbi:PglL family O-oligosaccharyltransferase [Algibacillus agarilyticus]|uniref:PglL family O-oligosaccharyltransferase n=1 Tax=Algibacillus agarilyticus TaxID=2234133 RepID=UPI000DD0849C|nr:O-antigen ligase family protein [Algibacillus agarilyticus]